MSYSSKNKKDWVLYILRCADGSLYTGITTDLDRRFQEHTSQGKNCAKYLKGRGPLRIVYQETVGLKGEALKREHSVKKLTKKEKEDLISSFA